MLKWPRRGWREPSYRSGPNTAIGRRIEFFCWRSVDKLERLLRYGLSVLWHVDSCWGEGLKLERKAVEIPSTVPVLGAPRRQSGSTPAIGLTASSKGSEPAQIELTQANRITTVRRSCSELPQKFCYCQHSIAFGRCWCCSPLLQPMQNDYCTQRRSNYRYRYCYCYCHCHCSSCHVTTATPIPHLYTNKKKSWAGGCGWTFP